MTAPVKPARLRFALAPFFCDYVGISNCFPRIVLVCTSCVDLLDILAYNMTRAVDSARIVSIQQLSWLLPVRCRPSDSKCGKVGIEVL